MFSVSAIAIHCLPVTQEGSCLPSCCFLDGTNTPTHLSWSLWNFLEMHLCWLLRANEADPRDVLPKFFFFLYHVTEHEGCAPVFPKGSKCNVVVGSAVVFLIFTRCVQTTYMGLSFDCDALCNLANSAMQVGESVMFYDLTAALSVVVNNNDSLYIVLVRYVLHFM